MERTCSEPGLKEEFTGTTADVKGEGVSGRSHHFISKGCRYSEIQKYCLEDTACISFIRVEGGGRQVEGRTQQGHSCK